MEIQEQLRVEHRKMNNAVPLMSQAADQIDQLKAQIGPLKERIAELEEGVRRAHAILESTVRAGRKESTSR